MYETGVIQHHRCTLCEGGRHTTDSLCQCIVLPSIKQDYCQNLHMTFNIISTLNIDSNVNIFDDNSKLIVYISYQLWATWRVRSCYSDVQQYDVQV